MWLASPPTQNLASIAKLTVTPSSLGLSPLGGTKSLHGGLQAGSHTWSPGSVHTEAIEGEAEGQRGKVPFWLSSSHLEGVMGGASALHTRRRCRDRPFQERKQRTAYKWTGPSHTAICSSLLVVGFLTRFVCGIGCFPDQLSRMKQRQRLFPASSGV